MEKLYFAKNKNSKVEIWGTGKPREFLHVSDFADFVIKVIKKNRKLKF